jgi:hypothetical protein
MRERAALEARAPPCGRRRGVQRWAGGCSRGALTRRGGRARQERVRELEGANKALEGRVAQMVPASELRAALHRAQLATEEVLRNARRIPRARVPGSRRPRAGRRRARPCLGGGWARPHSHGGVTRRVSRVLAQAGALRAAAENLVPKQQLAAAEAASATVREELERLQQQHVGYVPRGQAPPASSRQRRGVAQSAGPKSV